MSAVAALWQRLLDLNLRAVIRRLEAWLETLLPGPAVAAYPVVFRTTEGSATVGQIEVKDDAAPLTASVTFVDSEGSPTTPDETPEWSSTDENVATVTASGDGMSAEVSIGSPGAAVIEVSTTETSTGEEIVAQGTITVTPGDTVMGSVEFTEGQTAELPAIDEGAPVEEPAEGEPEA